MLEKTAAMHNSVKKILLKTCTHEGGSPSISPQVTTFQFHARTGSFCEAGNTLQAHYTLHTTAQSVFLKSFGAQLI